MLDDAPNATSGISREANNPGDTDTSSRRRREATRKLERQNLCVTVAIGFRAQRQSGMMLHHRAMARLSGGLANAFSPDDA